MTLRQLSLFLVSILGTSIAMAANPPKPPMSDIAAGLMSIKIDGMQDLPISGIKMVKSGEQTVFISSNGRFAFYGGKLMDIWTQQEIKDLADIDNIANRIDLSRMKLKADDLGAVTVGHGKAQVLVFIDPRCPYCGKVMKDLQALQDQYTFKLVMIPILGPESQNLVVQLACQRGSNEPKAKDAVRDRLLKQDYTGLPTEPPTQCNKEPLQKAVVTAKLFDLKGVPFLIAPDGRTHSGAPEVLADWLADKPKPSPSLATTPTTNAQNANAPEKQP
jgi:thiol:disulfide interchange protein DsbC